MYIIAKSLCAVRNQTKMKLIHEFISEQTLNELLIGGAYDGT